MWKKVVFLFSMFMCIASFTFAMTITGMGQAYHPISPYARNTTTITNLEGKKLNFVGNDSYLTFTPNNQGNKKIVLYPYGHGRGAMWMIHEIYTDDPTIRLWSVEAFSGSKGFTCGYWILGEKKGQYQVYVSTDHLISYGYQIKGPGKVKAKIVNGRYVMELRHANFDYSQPDIAHALTLPLDNTIVIDWDSEAQWFSIGEI